GWRNHCFVEVHHIRLRSEGGSVHPSNLVTLCSAHHDAIHAGKLSLTGTAPDALCFRHAERSSYGCPPDPRAVDVRTKAFGALRNLGFREGEVRRALSELATRSDGEVPTVEALVRAALALLT